MATIPEGMEDAYRAALPHYRTMKRLNNGGKPADQSKEWRVANSEMARLLGGTPSTHPESPCTYTIVLGILTPFQQWAEEQLKEDTSQ